MLKTATATMAKKNEFDIDSDGEIVQTTKQKLSKSATSDRRKDANTTADSTHQIEDEDLAATNLA